ncbi:peptidase family M48-domain-containing protein [Flammula alnicola]|nr:peptidase family M48-domain-containing protein [Flammula alnicola]
MFRTSTTLNNWRWLSQPSTCRNPAAQIRREIWRTESTAWFGRNLRQFSCSSARRNRVYIRFSPPDDPKRPGSGPHHKNLQDRRIQIAIGAGVLGTAYYVSHLEQVPDTGRWRFMNTSPQFEAKIGEVLREQLREELKAATLPPNHPLSIHVRRVVTRVLHASNLGILRGEVEPTFRSPFGMGTDPEGHAWNPDVMFGAAAAPGPVYGPDKVWDVIVVNDIKVINAMASPGIIVVFTGILPVCQDEEGLAAVLSHEIGHVVARHTAERMSSQTISWALLILLSTLLGANMSLTNFFQTLLLDLPNSRTQEREADLIGLRLMSRACYDPQASPKMFARLGQLESKIATKSNLDFFQTHPSSESRVKMLEEALPEGYAILAANPDCDRVRQEIESFKATAHAIKADDKGEWGFA